MLEWAARELERTTAKPVSDTIFAVSSGAPPAGIAVIRVSGANAHSALTNLAKHVPEPRRASVRLLIHPITGEPLDRALVLWMPGPATVTGEDLVELHCHGGRAVVSAVEAVLGQMAGLRKAEAGEFTRRAFDNQRLDLNAVEGLSDLLAAETQGQRRAALAMAEGHFSRRIENWKREILIISAMAEAALDFSDEDDVPANYIEHHIKDRIAALMEVVDATLKAPSAERLRDGVSIVLAGPPNAGKSTLLNALVGREAAIVSDIAGTTRDRIEVPVALGGVAFVITDTAGLRDMTDDAVEAIGIERTRVALEAADIILWLGDPADVPRDDAILVAAKTDRPDHGARPGLAVSALSGLGIDTLTDVLIARANMLLPVERDFALHARQRRGVASVYDHLAGAKIVSDLLVIAEELRLARKSIDALSGRAGTEDMLDRLFSGFCIGK